MNTETPAITPAPMRRWPRMLAALAVTGLAVHAALPAVREALSTVSTDDAYVNGHVSFVAPRVTGQVTRVLVDDNVRVHAGDRLLELDPEPYRIQVELKQAALVKAEASLKVAQAQSRGVSAQLISQRWKLERAMELVRTQVAQLKSKLATHASQKAAVARAAADGDRARKLIQSGNISREELDHRERSHEAADANADAALQEVYQIRAGLGLPAQAPFAELAHVPADLALNHSSVRQALAELVQTGAQLGVVPPSTRDTPDVVMQDFRNHDPQGNVDHVLERLIREAPAVLDAAAAVETARHELDAAQLNLRWTDVRAPIDGVVTRRSVNAGNTVQAGQSVMAVRSLSEIWVDANFKETQLADLRIGQRVDLYVDMYGSARTFNGRITGFTMGTGSTLALLPAQNATGNFVKVVQRLPVRIELTGPVPEDAPLFAGLSVTPVVHIEEPATGPDAGRFLQPHRSLNPAGALASAEVRP